MVKDIKSFIFIDGGIVMQAGILQKRIPLLPFVLVCIMNFKKFNYK
jgi:hypothetical protein